MVIAESVSDVPPLYHFISPKARAISFGNLELSPFTIAFAGRLYKGVHATLALKHGSPSIKYAQFYDSDQLISWVKTQDPSIDFVKLDTKINKIHKPSWTNSLVLGEHLENQANPEFDSILSSTKMPILVAGPSTFGMPWLRSNVMLKPFSFFKVLSSSMAFQELDMWISSRMTSPSSPPLEIEDKVRAQQRGFDCHSFRKSPTKRAPKTCLK